METVAATLVFTRQMFSLHSGAKLAFDAAESPYLEKGL